MELKTEGNLNESLSAGRNPMAREKYLDGLTKGDHPRLRRVKNGKSYLYFPIQEKSTAEK